MAKREGEGEEYRDISSPNRSVTAKNRVLCEPEWNFAIGLSSQFLLPPGNLQNLKSYILNLTLSMLLKRLELSGFKSFAHPTVLEFSTPVTAVVGPNGSGKSNIAEAMRFVLGEQSMKSLRGKRGEDLIFHGSKSLHRQNRASVAVVFDNKDGVFPLDYDEIEIKRAVYRDGDNHYFINGSRTRLKDIFELLAAVHIGATSHHIISQGETDRILNSSIKERRGMIEDALGLKVYHYKLKESEQKLQKTKENIAQSENVKKEIATHLGFLERQDAKIQETEKLRAELLVLYKEYLSGEHGFLSRQKTLLTAEKSAPEKERAEVACHIREKEAFLKNGKREDGEGGHAQALEAKIRELRHEKDGLSRALGRLEGLIEYSEREKEKRARQDGERVMFPRGAFEDFWRDIKNVIGRGEEALNIETAKVVFRSIKEKISLFFSAHGEREKSEYDVVTVARLVAEKVKTKHKNTVAEEKEKQFLHDLETERHAHEKERGAERVLEQELFALRTRENELTTRMELFSYRGERLRQEENRFQDELKDAGFLLGTDVLRFADMPQGQTPPSREEQEKKKHKIERMKIKIEGGGAGGADVLKEYEEVKASNSFLEKEILDLAKSAESLEKLIKELFERIDTEFKNGVAHINEEFQEIFSSLFGAGNASLLIVTAPPKKRRALHEEFLPGEEDEGEEEIPEEGVDIAVTLPTKRVKGLGVLSGGERSLTSIALVFAITLVNPPPFLILDETDAALDESNSRKYGGLLQKLKKSTQFIVITHNRETMTQAGVLYGVTSAPDGTSRVLSVKLGEAEDFVDNSPQGPSLR